MRGLRAVVTADDAPSPDLLTELYIGHYTSLVRLAALLLDDVAASEDVVQEAYVRLASNGRLPASDKALAYLRQTVVNLSRSAMRHRQVVERTLPVLAGREQTARDRMWDLLVRDEVVAALRMLAPRQREVVVLRYYAELPEREVAELLGISQGSVKAYAARGLDALAERMGAHS